MELFLVGHNLLTGENDWEFAGIFSTEQLAIDNCFDWTYFVAKVTLDGQVSQEPTPFEYKYYPKSLPA